MPKQRKLKARSFAPPLAEVSDLVRAYGITRDQARQLINKIGKNRAKLDEAARTLKTRLHRARYWRMGMVGGRSLNVGHALPWLSPGMSNQAEAQSAARRPFDWVRHSRLPKIRLGPISIVITLALWLVEEREALAQTCVVSGPRYMLIAEAVQWSMEIKSGHRCVRGVRFRDVEFDRLTLVSPPQSGHVTIQGPAFTYVAKSDFDGHDSFTLTVSGAVSKRRGISTILVTVSIIGTHRGLAAPGPAEPVGTPSSGFPDATNTGVPPGVTLTRSGSITIDTAGAVVSGLDITGQVVISAQNVTLRNCKVRATTFVGVYVTGTGAMIENCEVISVYSNGSTKGIWFDDTATGGAVRKCNIHDVEDGVYISTKNITVTDNYIHDLNSTGFDPHYDGIQLHGGVTSDVTIRHNSVIVALDRNSAITMGTVQNVLIDGNRLSGGGYTIHVDGRFGEGTVSGVSITNNRFGSHTVDYMTFERAMPVVRGNVDDVTGKPLIPY
jgi:Right handed beta helix region